MARDTTRRRRLSGIRRAAIAAVSALVFVGVVSACSSSESPGPQESAGSAFPVTIDHKFGSTTIPTKPERVVTVGWNDQDFALALGTVPVATRAWFDGYNQYPWVKTVLDGTPLPTFSDEINFEAITQQRPDLILAIYETIDQETYDKLSDIAPTVIQTSAYPDEETPWDVQTLTTGKALGKSEQAQTLVDSVKGKIDAAKAAHPEFATATLVEDFGPENGGHYLIGKGDPRRALFDALGFQAQDVTGDVSEERLDLLNRDVLFVNGATKEQMAASPVFSRLPVVAEDRTLYTSFDSPLGGALSYSGPNALLYALDTLVPQLANAVDKDPATAVSDLSNA